MRPIDPVELSGLIDGELPFSRAEEVRGALAEECIALRSFAEVTLQAFRAASPASA